MWTEKLPNGKTKYCDRYTDPLTGRPHRVSITMDRDNQKARAQAERELQQRIRRELDNPTRTTTLSALRDAYVRHQKMTVRKSTWERNSIALKSILRVLGENIVVDKMNVGYIRNKFLETKKSPGTLNEWMRRLKAMLRYGYQAELIEKDLASRLDRFHDIPHKAKIREKYMEASELRKLLSQMTVTEWKELTEFLALSGLRFGEAAALNNEDVDLKARVIHVTKTYDSVNREIAPAKSVTSIRDVYIQSEMMPTCKRIRRMMKEKKLRHGIDSDLFLFDDAGDHIPYYAYNKYLRENTQALLGRKLTPHSLRHTHASLMFEKGVDLETISRRLGHENSAITREIYLHVTDVLRKKDYAIIEGVKVL